jgi:hypothetical protein
MRHFDHPDTGGARKNPDFQWHPGGI